MDGEVHPQYHMTQLPTIFGVGGGAFAFLVAAFASGFYDGHMYYLLSALFVGALLGGFLHQFGIWAGLAGACVLAYQSSLPESLAQENSIAPILLIVGVGAVVQLSSLVWGKAIHPAQPTEGNEGSRRFHVRIAVFGLPAWLALVLLTGFVVRTAVNSPIVGGVTTLTVIVGGGVLLLLTFFRYRDSK